MTTFSRLQLRRIFAVLTIVLAVLAILLAFNSIRTYLNNYQASKDFTKARTEEIAQDIARELVALQLAIKDVKERLENQATTSTLTISKALEYGSINHDGFVTLGVAMAPGTVPLEGGSGKYSLYAPFRVEGIGRVTLDRVDNYYDYQDRRSCVGWYRSTIGGQTEWGSAYYEPSLNKFILRYTQPLNAADESVMGVAFVDVDLAWFKDKMDNYDLLDNGYAVIINKNERVPRILYHSLEGTEKITRQLNDSCRNTQTQRDDQLDRSQKLASKELRGLTPEDNGKRVVNRLTHSKSWYNEARIGDTELYLRTVMNYSPDPKLPDDGSLPGVGEIILNANSVSPVDKLLNTKVISGSGIISLIVVFILLITLLYVYFFILPGERSLKQSFVDSAVISLLFTFGIVSIWGVQYNLEPTGLLNSTIVSNSAVVKSFQEDYSGISLGNYHSPPAFIPTGLFIQSIEFISATKVSLSGYLWQRYPIGIKHSDEPGVIFAEAIDTNIVPAFEREDGNETVVGWYFETTLTERFDYSYFPFDRQSVWIRMWSKQFIDNTVLVPDFKSYDSLNPRSLPGLEEDLPLFGWEAESSYYDIRVNRYNSNFGQSDFLSRNFKPELYFNIQIQRDVLNPLISHLFPLSVVLLMLFAITVTISRSHENSNLLGFNVSAVIGSCTALFFVVLIAQVQLRRELSALSFVYLEYFYFVTYVVILLITVNSILFTWNVATPLVQYKNNLIPKLVYWPLILGVLFFCTAFTFWL